MDGGAWKAAVQGVAEGRTRLSDFTFTFHFDALEKEMATHSSVLAWRIPGTGKPDGLPYGVAQSRTRLKRLSSSSSSSKLNPNAHQWKNTGIHGVQHRGEMSELLLHTILWIKLKNNVKEKQPDMKEHIPSNYFYMEFDSLFVALRSQ